MTHQIKIIAAALLLALSIPATAGELTLSAPGASDSVPARLSNAVTKNAAALETAPLQFAWRLDAEAPLSAISAPHQAASKEYWDTRTASELSDGVSIPTTSAGAIVRLSPAAGASTKALEARRVVLIKDGLSYADGAGMKTLADSDELAKGDVPFPVGSTVFRIDPKLGAGAFKLQVPQATGDTVVHVFEPDSSVQLDLKADRTAYQAGGVIKVDAALRDGDAMLKATEIRGMITAGDGQIREFAFVADKAGGYRAQLPADLATDASHGLFEIQTFVSAGSAKDRILRDARTAFAYSVPSARFTGAARKVAMRMRDPFVHLEFDVEVASASRYQIGGVLYGTDQNGVKVPLAMAQSAQLLEPGVHGMTLFYGPDVLDGAKAGAPYEIRDLQLVNQADMGVQEQRVVALTLETAH